jgi:hypothetical protein
LSIFVWLQPKLAEDYADAVVSESRIHQGHGAMESGSIGG